MIIYFSSFVRSFPLGLEGGNSLIDCFFFKIFDGQYLVSCPLSLQWRHESFNIGQFFLECLPWQVEHVYFRGEDSICLYLLVIGDLCIKGIVKALWVCK